MMRSPGKETKQIVDVSAARPPEGRLTGTDTLTGILDRTGLLNATAWVELVPGSSWSMLFLRVDQLTGINGRLGRTAGDAVLATVADRLCLAARRCAVARISARTFVALKGAGDSAQDWASDVLEAVTKPMVVEGIGLHVSVAAALVSGAGQLDDMDSTLLAAERAARPLLVSGRCRIEPVDLGPVAPLPRLVASSTRVSEALTFGEITAEYQPIVDLKTMQPVGAEALARWPGAPSGLEDPEDFLEIVRALGRSSEVLDSVLTAACEEFASGPAADRGWWVSVNIDTQDCADPTLPSRVKRILEKTGMRPEHLLLEVSERAIPDPSVGRALRNLAALGIKLAVDDFGSGWSSLAQLRSLPIDLIKIDRSVVASRSAIDMRLLMATLALAEALGVRTLAEGVEDGELLLLLCLAECDFGQGFWWSKPDSLEALLVRFPPPAEEPDDEGLASVFDMDLVRRAAHTDAGFDQSDEVFDQMVRDAIRGEFDLEQ